MGASIGRRLLVVACVWLLAGLAWGVPTLARAGSTTAGVGAFCDRVRPLSAREQDVALRFAAVVREQLAASADASALISRSGLDLARFGIRDSHAAVAWRDAHGAWATRQLYYACGAGQPRLYDQGVAGFVLGMDDASHGHVAIVRLHGEAAATLWRTVLETPRALRLLGTRYSANAYPFSTRYQNCNQWLAEVFAVAWGGLPDGPDLRERAQRWLFDAGYRPEFVPVDSHALMFAAPFVPFVHLDDHPEADRYALHLRVSLPVSLESFVRTRWPDSERVEICHDGARAVVHSGWTPLAADCTPEPGDRVVRLD